MLTTLLPKGRKKVKVRHQGPCQPASRSAWSVGLSPVRSLKDIQAEASLARRDGMRCPPQIL